MSQNADFRSSTRKEQLMIRNRIFRITFSFLIITALFLSAVITADAAGDAKYTDPDTNYRVVIIDDDDLLTDAEESHLVDYMKPITAYGNVAFWTTSEYTSNEIDQARIQRRELFGFESGCIFVINMNVRKLTIQSYGKIYESVNDSFARSITDNASSYATSGNYFQCAALAYEQVLAVIENRQISEPLKVSGYAVISVMLGLITAIAIAFSKKHNALIQFDIPEKADRYRASGSFSGNVNAVYVGHITEHRPPKTTSSSSGSSCSSCSSCSSGSSCGGCGGGGSSSF